MMRYLVLSVYSVRISMILNRVDCLLFLILSLFAACRNPKPRLPVQRSVEKSRIASFALEKFKKVYEKEDSLILLRLKDDLDVETSPYGFYYSVLESVDVPEFRYPVSGSKVRLKYKIYTLGGRLIYGDSFRELAFALDRSSEVISGLNQGVRLMPEGSSFRFFFSSFQAYGIWGDGKRIPPNTPLVYDVELVEVLSE